MVFLDVTTPFLPYNFCFLHWVTVPASQLAEMACLQVITKTGIRLHRNLHVCDSCYLPQQNPPTEHHLLFSRVWHSELGTFEVTAHFPRGGRAHTGSSPHSFPALHFPWESVSSDAQRVKWQLWPSPACTSLFQNLAGVTPRSRKHLRCSKLSGPGFHLSNGRTEDNLGESHWGNKIYR